MMDKTVLVVVIIVAAHRRVEASDAMRFLASGFIKVLDECKQELNMTDQIVSDLYHYWKLDYSHLTRDTGCAIICMSKKLDLIDTSGKMHHDNAKEFAVRHGAEVELASKLVAAIHDCENQYTSIEDDCSRVLEVAKCFRTDIHQLHYSPKVDVIVTEVLTEI